MILKKIQIFLLAWMLLFLQSIQAIDVNTLSEQEKSIVSKLGISDNDLKKLDADTLKESLQEKFNVEKNTLKEQSQAKIQAVISEKVEPKLAEAKAAVQKTSDELKKDTTQLAAGYITSTISLFAAALIAPQVIMVCKTKPSAVIYAGTAAIYVLQEMRNIKILKASQLAEIEVVDNISVDKTKSVKENAKKLNEKVDQQIGYIKAYKGTLDSAVVALKNKAKNAKMVSIGFLAASASAVAEQLNIFGGGGTCVIASSVEKINFSKELDQKYATLISQSKNTEDKWAYYYEWESLKFGTKRTLTLNEYTNLKSTPVSSGILLSAMNFIQSNLVASAFAAEDSKKVTVVEQLKNNKAADWIGDLDKLGIAGGLAINIVAYMTGWQMGFLKSVIASGTSRAVVFGLQGGLAYTAGSLFETAAKDLEKKLAKVDELINKIQTGTKVGINILTPSDADASRFKDLALKIGVSSDKLITEMSINDAGVYLKNIGEKVEKLDDEGKVLLQKFEADLKEKVKENVQQKKEEPKSETSTSYFSEFIGLFFGNVYAAESGLMIVSKIKDIECVEKKSCPVIQFPKMNTPNSKFLNQYLSLYENYYQGVRFNNQNVSDRAFETLEKNKGTVINLRAAMFKQVQDKNKSPYNNYDQFERAGKNDAVKDFAKFYSTLTPSERDLMNRKLNPIDSNFAFESMDSSSQVNPGAANKKAILNAEELKILSLLINRLEASESVHNKGPDLSFVGDGGQKDNEYNFGNTSIHPKESELFDIIHVRYLQFIQKNYPELNN